MKLGSQIYLHPLRIFSYLVIFVLDILLYVILRSYFFMVIAVMLTICAAASAFGMWKLAGRIRLEAGMDSDVTERDETVFVNLRLVNPIWYAALDSKLSMRAANTFLGSESGLEVSMPVKPGGVSALMLPIKLIHLGRFQVSCAWYQIQDLMGMVSFQIPCRIACDVNIIPKANQNQEIEISGYLSGMAETEESHQKGSDFAEVSDIREYIPGDRIRDIHWKLSAKQDTLMVKERVSMAGSEIMILLQLSDNKDYTQQILSYGFDMVLAFIAQRVPVCLICWNQKNYQFEEFSCSSRQELCQAFAQIYETPFRERLQELQEQYMKNCYPFLGTYLVVLESHGKVQVVIRDNA